MPSLPNPGEANPPERVSREDMRRFLVGPHDVAQAAVDLATEGLVDAEDLWWLFESHRIMAPGSAWLLVEMWSDNGDDVPADLGSISFWRWWDQGVVDATWEGEGRHQ